MQSFGSRAFAALGKLTASLSLTLALTGCGQVTEGPAKESVGETNAKLIQLDADTTVETGAPSPRTASCPGGKLPDQCGSWAGVELHASRLGGDKKECEQAVDETSHCLCAPIEFRIPDRLPVISGASGWDWDKPTLSFRDTAGKQVQCRYRGTGSSNGKKPAAGAPDYLLDGCSNGYRAGNIAHADSFDLDLGKCHPGADPVEVALRLGAPDVVGGVVQEQVFYASDPRIAGAALHVPRGSAPPFATFSLDTLPQVTPGLAIPNGNSPATTLGYGVDVHSDQTDHFVFNHVAGAACPRIDLPYDPAVLESIMGPNRESAIRADQILTLTGLTTGDSVLASAGPVTVNLTQHTLSFCVEHLSFYVGNAPGFDSLLNSASIDDGTTSYQLVAPPTTLHTNGTLAGSLPLLNAGTEYTLTLKFENDGPITAKWDANVTVVPVSVTYGASSQATPTVITSSWSPTYALDWSTPAPVNKNAFGTATITIKAPTPTATTPVPPLNFCLAHSGTPFGYCFSWDTNERGGTTNVAVAEICDGLDNDLDNDVDEGLPTATYYLDADGDGYGDPNTTKVFCKRPAGYVSDNTDCDDTNSAHNVTNFYPDCDFDGHGGSETCIMQFTESAPTSLVEPITGCVDHPPPKTIEWGFPGSGDTLDVPYVTSSDDCANFAADTYPGAPELCDFRDNNCNGTADDETRDVSWSYDKDFDGWCEPGSLAGCAGSAPDGQMIKSSSCQSIIAIPDIFTTDCNDQNSQANYYCGPLQILGPSDTINGGLIGSVDFRSFSATCARGWHIESCEAVKTSTDGNVSIDVCPVGQKSGTVDVRYGISAFKSVTGYGIANCVANDSFLF